MKKATTKVSPSRAKEGLSLNTPTSDFLAERRELARDLAILIRRKLREDALQVPRPTADPRA